MSDQDQAQFVYEREIEVRWSDMDALGHVNNACYFTYFEMARTGWFQQEGVGLPSGKNDLTVVVAHVEVDYFQPIVYPSNVMVKVYVTQPGNSSMSSFYEICDAKDQSICYSKSSAVLVWFDPQTQKPARIPDRVRDLVD